MSVYLATFVGLAWLRLLHVQWVAALAVLVATAVSIAFWEKGRWNLGLLAAPGITIRELLGGALFACVLVGVADVLIIATTAIHHAAGTGFPWLEVIGIFVPAVVHEELLFRGYGYQKLRGWGRIPAIGLTSLIFMALHWRNHGVTALALANIFLGGVLLALAYERHRRLLWPLGLHFAWNLAAGPILGWEVSGYIPAASLLSTEGSGPEMLTGGGFGIEGSAWMTAAECAGIGWLWKSNAEGKMQNAE